MRSILFRRRGKLLYAQRDAAVARSELESVANEIVNDLVQPKPVADEQRGQRAHFFRLVANPLFESLRSEHVVERPYERPEIERLALDVDLAAFDLAHVEDVVDERHEMLGRHVDLLEAGSRLLLVVRILERDGGHAHDAVHRRADLVRHAREELAFRQAGAPRFLGSALGAVLLVRQQTRVALDQLIVDREEDGYDRDDHGRHENGVLHEHPAESRHVLVHHAVGHGGTQIPVLIAHRPKVQVLVMAPVPEGKQERLPVLHGFSHLVHAVPLVEASARFQRVEQVLAVAQPLGIASCDASAVEADDARPRAAIDQIEVELPGNGVDAEPGDDGGERDASAGNGLEGIHERDGSVVEHHIMPARIAVRQPQLAAGGKFLIRGGVRAPRRVVEPVAATQRKVGVLVIVRLHAGEEIPHLVEILRVVQLKRAAHGFQLAELAVDAGVEMGDDLVAELLQVHFAHGFHRGRRRLTRRDDRVRERDQKRKDERDHDDGDAPPLARAGNQFHREDAPLPVVAGVLHCSRRRRAQYYRSKTASLPGFIWKTTEPSGASPTFRVG